MSLEELAQNLSTQPSSEPSVRKPPISERRLEANRRNARRSTGPKTPRGKHFAARNAIKHGLLRECAAPAQHQWQKGVVFAKRSH